MLITRTPLRITLGGGGTDLPSYYEAARRHGHLGRHLQAHLHLDQPHVHRRLLPEVLRAGAGRQAATRSSTRSSARCCSRHDVGPGVEIVSTADIPSGTGLGSSGSFTVGLLKRRPRDPARPRQRRRPGRARPARSRSTGWVAPVGKQDQYIAAFGGITRFDFEPDGSRRRRAGSRLSQDTMHDLEEHLLMFFTGYSRAADEVLAEQAPSRTRRRPGDDRQPALRQGPRAAPARRAREGRRPGVRRPHARALGEQEEAVELDVERRASTTSTTSAGPTARAAASWSAPGPAAS